MPEISSPSLPKGPLQALLAAALFGVAPVLCKLVINDMSPLLLAGLLYLGSGMGLSLTLVGRGSGLCRELSRISSRYRRTLLGAVLSGGVIAPACLAYGIRYGTASEVALLLNLETVATTLIARLIFREHVSAHVWAGKGLIVLAAALVVLGPQGGAAFSASGLLVTLACLFWGVDNNLTREVEELSPTVLAAIKGYGAGLFNIVLALFLGSAAVTVGQVGGVLLIGAFSCGLSLVLFIGALREIGSARTSTFFSVGPFIGVLFSLLLFPERPHASFWLATALMLAGVALLCRERHDHLHTHLPHEHRHRHDHDEHHCHDHDRDTEDQAPHDHYHVHAPLTHRHLHWPDIHHRHGH
jgi:drug/metabolite transporter (DMT)-like permease